MMKTRVIIALIVITLSSCHSAKKANSYELKVEVQGHRGDRGNFPENSLPAFYSSIDKGAEVIELDVVVSKDGQIVVSHEPFMSSEYMSLPDGTPVTKAMEKSLNLYEMTYAEIRKYDGGSRGNVRFSDQRKIKTYKPLLSEMIDSVEAYANRKNKARVRYNLEIKSLPWEYNKSQPEPAVFVDKVMTIVSQKGISSRMNIQSFDPFIVNEVMIRYPKMTTAFLTDKAGVAKNLQLLKKKPQIYSPHYSKVNPEMIDSLRQLGIRIIPWTVNEIHDIERMLSYKVDGIITDYPERVLGRR